MEDEKKAMEDKKKAAGKAWQLANTNYTDKEFKIKTRCRSCAAAHNTKRK